MWSSRPEIPHTSFNGETVGGKPDIDPDQDESNVQVRLRFPGQYADAESGLVYVWNRYLDPKTGRWTTADRMSIAEHVERWRANMGKSDQPPLEGNPYVYVANNPLKWIDPEGLLGKAGGRGPYAPYQGPGASVGDIAGNVAEMLGGKRELTGCYLTCIAANAATCGTVVSGYGLSGLVGRGASAACRAKLNRSCIAQCEGGPQCLGSTAPYDAP